MKQISLEKRKEYVEELKRKIGEQQRIIEQIESFVPSSLEEKIIHEYAIEGAVKAVADKINAEGHRIEGRKYISNDISAIIKQKPKSEMHEIARKAFEHNKKGIGY